LSASSAHRGADRLHAWLTERCNEINGEFDRLLTIHVGTPRPDQDHHLPPEPFDRPKPNEPVAPQGSAWDRIFPWAKRHREERFERATTVYRHELEQWEQARVAHEQDWERRRHRTEDERLSSLEVMHDLLEEALHSVVWPRETQVQFEIEPSLKTLRAELDLPQLEHLPTRQAAVALRGLKLNLHEHSEAQIRKAYVTYVHGAVFRVIGEGFAALPTLETVVCSGYSERADPATGAQRNDYLISVRVARHAWSRIDFANLGQVDPVAALGQFDLRCDCSASGQLDAIEPIEA